MSVKLNLGKKKKTFNSIMEAAKVVAAQTGEPTSRVYIRVWKRLHSGKSVRQAVVTAPRKYVRQVEQQASV